MKVAACAVAAFLCACADSRLGTIDSRYQRPSLPVHFRNPEDRTEVALGVAWNDQAPVDRRLVYRERSDGRNLHLSRDTANHYPYADIEEHFHFEREPLAIGGSITWQQGMLFSGLAGGLVPLPSAWPKMFHFGAFAGLSAAKGPVVWSAGAGFFANQMKKEVHYWGYGETGKLVADVADSLFDGQHSSEDSVFSPDSLSGWTRDYEFRANAAVSLRSAARWWPYLFVEAGWVRFWRWPTEGNPADDPLLFDAGSGGGVEMRLIPRLPVRAEFRYAWVGISGASKLESAMGAPDASHFEAGLHAAWEW